MNRQPRVLVVSYAFPPFGEVGSIRISQFCRYLPDAGIEPIVLTLREDLYEPRDPTIHPPANVRVIRTTMLPNPLTWYGTLKARAQSSPLPPSPGAARKSVRSPRLRDHILALLQIPDRHWGWYLPAVRAGSKLLREEHVDAILSSGPPWISHVIARHLKKKFRLPWLIDFRDPWASFVGRERPDWWHNLAKRMEASSMRLADLVLCNTDRLRQAFERQYPELNPSKFRTLNNGFEYLPVPSTKKTSSKRLLLHLGSIYGMRRIDTFLTAVSDLVAAGELAPDSFQVLFQGDNSPALVAEAAHVAPDLLARKCVEFRPRVTWAEAQNLLYQADLLLLFQGGHELQVPAKFYEYLQTGIPMFAITEEGALTDILQATESGIWAHSSDSRQIARQLRAALRLPRRSLQYVKTRYEANYHYSGLAGKLGGWIKELSPATRS